MSLPGAIRIMPIVPSEVFAALGFIPACEAIFSFYRAFASAGEVFRHVFSPRFRAAVETALWFKLEF
jgi:hypothetical protein